MYCKQCGTPIADDSKFCAVCGCQFTNETTAISTEVQNINNCPKKKDRLSNFSLVLSAISTLFPIGVILNAPILCLVGLMVLLPAFAISNIALIIALLKRKKQQGKNNVLIKRIIASFMSTVLPIVFVSTLLGGILQKSDDDDNSATDTAITTVAPIKMTAEYSNNEENYYGYKILESDFYVYLHWDDGTKKLTRNFVIENEDCYLTPENTVKTFNLKSTEYDLKASVNIQIPQVQSFPESRKTFVQKYYEAMQGIGINQYTMELETTKKGNIIGANFRDSKGAYWYFLSFSNQTDNDESSDFDEVKIETNVQYNREEMEKMKLLLISLTIPEGSYTANSAYNLLQNNGGNLTAKNVEYSAYFNVKNNYSTNYYLIAYVTQLKAYSVDGK